jgi:hypothetical protein
MISAAVYGVGSQASKMVKEEVKPRPQVITQRTVLPWQY